MTFNQIYDLKETEKRSDRIISNLKDSLDYLTLGMFNFLPDISPIINNQKNNDFLRSITNVTIHRICQDFRIGKQYPFEESQITLSSVWFVNEPVMVVGYSYYITSQLLYTSKCTTDNIRHPFKYVTNEIRYDKMIEFIQSIVNPMAYIRANVITDHTEISSLFNPLPGGQAIDLQNYN